MHVRRAGFLHASALAAVVTVLLAGAPDRAAGQLVDSDIRVRESLADLQARVARDTNDPVAYFDLGLGYWSKKKYDQADSTLRKAVALDPEMAEAHLAIALVQMPNKSHWQNLRRAHGDTALAQEVRFRQREYARAFMIDPFLDVQPVGLFPKGYDSAYESLERIRTTFRDRFARPMDSMPPALLWLHSLAAARTNRVRAALQDVMALARIAGRYQQTDSLGEAPLATNQYLFMLAALFQRLGDRENAVSFFQAVLNNDIGNYEAHVQLAKIYEAGTDWSHALQERRAAVGVFPENHRLVLDLGVTEYRAGNLPEAEQTLHDAQADAPRDPDPYYWLGVVQQARGDTASAKHDYGEFLRLAPSRDSTQIAAARRALGAPH